MVEQTTAISETAKANTTRTTFNLAANNMKNVVFTMLVDGQRLFRLQFLTTLSTTPFATPSGKRFMYERFEGRKTLGFIDTDPLSKFT